MRGSQAAGEEGGRLEAEAGRLRKQLAAVQSERDAALSALRDAEVQASRLQVGAAGAGVCGSRCAHDCLRGRPLRRALATCGCRVAAAQPGSFCPDTAHSPPFVASPQEHVASLSGSLQEERANAGEWERRLVGQQGNARKEMDVAAKRLVEAQVRQNAIHRYRTALLVRSYSSARTVGRPCTCQ